MAVMRDISTARRGFNLEGPTVDAIGSMEWEEKQEERIECRVRIIRINGGNRKRETQDCELQNVYGGHSIWQTDRSYNLDVMTLEKIIRSGGNLVKIEDQSV